MNLDNQRLREIQESKLFYGIKLEQANTIEDSLIYMNKIENLEIEEKEILKRCDVRI